MTRSDSGLPRPPQSQPTLNERELICLGCPLPECDEKDPGCLYHQTFGEGHKNPIDRSPPKRWGKLYEMIRQLEPGKILKIDLGTDLVTRAQRAVINMVHRGNLPQVKTHRAIGEESGFLYVMLKEE